MVFRLRELFSCVTKYFNRIFCQIKCRDSYVVSPLLFKHFSFKQHQFKTLTFLAIIKAGISLNSTNIC